MEAFRYKWHAKGKSAEALSCKWSEKKYSDLESLLWDTFQNPDVAFYYFKYLFIYNLLYYLVSKITFHLIWASRSCTNLCLTVGVICLSCVHLLVKSTQIYILSLGTIIIPPYQSVSFSIGDITPVFSIAYSFFLIL